MNYGQNGMVKKEEKKNLNMPQHCHPCILFQLVHNNLEPIVIQPLSTTTNTFFTASAVIGFPSLSIAPSDTMMMFNLV